MRRERTRGKTSAFARAAATVALVLPLAVITAACSDSVTAAQTPPAVRIGAIYNLTGGQAALDGPSLDGARLAVDRINARGGLLGRRVELLERDGQTNEKDVSRAAASLVASGCSAIIGLSDTDQVLAAAPIAARAGVPFVTSGATSPLLPTEVPNWLFLACFGDNAQAAASAQYASEQLGARTAAILYDRKLDYTRLLARYFGRSFRAQGGNVLVTADYEKPGQAVLRLTEGASGPDDEEAAASEDESGSDEGASSSGDESGSSDESGSGDESGSSDESGSGDATSEGEPAAGGESTGQGESEASGEGGSQQSESAAGTDSALPLAAQADVLFVAAAPEDAARLVRRLRAAGYRQPVMGGDSFDSAGLVKMAEKTGGKIYYTTHAGSGMSSASRAVRRFDANYRSAYGRAPQNAFAALGYDAVGLVASAIRRADSVKPSEVRDALQATRHYPGVTGTLSYAGDDRVPHKKVTLVCVGRRPVVVAQFTPGYVAEP
jgi:ABC-type branched-subunit amino acid transport system substrate-binding protein